MTTIDQYNFHDKKALVRVDLNVPLDADFHITDETRLKAAVPTISKIVSDGGSVILMTHLGRPKNGPEEKFSLRHIIPNLQSLLDADVQFADDCVSEESYVKSSQLKAGDILLLENLRFYSEETSGDESFAKSLAKHGNVYVNDAFGTAHRAHASTAVIAKFFGDRVCGQVMENELANAKKVLENPQRPFTAIMGGAKISDKILIIEKLLDKVDNLIIGGGMAYTFFKAIGGQIGDSLVEEGKLELAKMLIKRAKEKGVNLELPTDSVIADRFAPDAKTTLSSNINIEPGWMGLDIGPEARQVFDNVIRDSRTVLWNGPMGVFEMEAFAKGTISVAKSVVEATSMGGYSLIGGGDSAAAINNLGYGDKVSYVSTGGGALLEYMEGKALPGVVALQ